MKWISDNKGEEGSNLRSEPCDTSVLCSLRSRSKCNRLTYLVRKLVHLANKESNSRMLNCFKDGGNVRAVVACLKLSRSSYFTSNIY